MLKASEIAIKDLPAIISEALGLSVLGFCFLVIAFCV
jgi:hypothetical protein